MARKRTPGNYALRKNGLVTFEDLTNCFTFFSLMLSTFDELVVWLRHNKLLKPKRFFLCKTCGAECEKYNRQRNVDGVSMRCAVHKKHETSIRKGSFFEKAKFNLHDVLTFVYFYAVKMPLYKVSSLTGVTYGPSSDKLAKKIRKVMSRYVYRMLKKIKFKGEVEVDESMFGRKVKHHRGNPRGTKIWIVGK